MQGQLAMGVLPGVLRSLYVERKTGMLHVTCEEERGSICFIRGNIVYGDTTIGECHLGETLVRQGLLTQWDLDRALEMVTVTGRRLGPILLDLGLLDQDGLEDGLAMQVREVLLVIFGWREGQYSFDPQDPEAFRGYDKPLRLSTAEVILDAVWSVSDPDVIRFNLGDLDRVLALASGSSLPAAHAALTPTDGYLLSRVDGELLARQILALAPVSEDEAQRSLFGLICTGLVVYLPSERGSRSPGAASLRRHILETQESFAMRDHYEVLGVTRDASADDIDEAHSRHARMYHPDGHLQPGLSDLKSVLASLLGRVEEAHRVLRDPAARAAYDKAVKAPPPPPVGPARSAQPPTAADPTAQQVPEPIVDPKLIEEHLDRAEEAVGAGRYYDAFALVDEALMGAKGRARRRARVLRAEARLKAGQGRRAAEEELKTAISEDAGNYDAHFLLGTIYKAGGAHTLAAGCFQRTLALRPRHAGALAELHSLPGEESRRRPGLGRFFGGS